MVVLGVGEGVLARRAMVLRAGQQQQQQRSSEEGDESLGAGLKMATASLVKSRRSREPARGREGRGALRGPTETQRNANGNIGTDGRVMSAFKLWRQARPGPEKLGDARCESGRLDRRARCGNQATPHAPLPASPCEWVPHSLRPSSPHAVRLVLLRAAQISWPPPASPLTRPRRSFPLAP